MWFALPIFYVQWAVKIIFSLICLWLLLEFFKKKEISKRSLILGFLIFLIIFSSFYFYLPIHLQKSFSQGTLSKYFLPPYSNHYYQVLARQITTYFSHILTALLVGMIFWLLVKITKSLVIDNIDAGLLAFGSLVAGWPDVFIFLSFVFIFVLLGSLITAIIKKGGFKARFIITPYIPLALLATIFFGPYLSFILTFYKIRF